jgi:hypothetical protein
MKIDPHLTVVKESKAGDAVPRPSQRPSTQTSQDGVVVLISQENQRAWQANPSSLCEARKVLAQVQNRLGNSPDEALAEIHRLDARCLLKIR